jgi:hypothetical protein
MRGSKMKNQKPTYVFVVRREDNGYYQHLYIDVRETGYNYDSPMLEFNWQGDKNTDYWYAGRVQIKSEKIADIESAFKLLKRIFNNDDRNYVPLPVNLIERFKEVKITQGAYDPRISHYIKVEDARPESILGWRDNYHKTGGINGSCVASALAETESEAKQLIAKELASREKADYLSLWSSLGMPVIAVDTYVAPKSAVELVSL